LYSKRQVDKTSMNRVVTAIYSFCQQRAHFSVNKYVYTLKSFNRHSGVKDKAIPYFIHLSAT